ncbi:hypothetical protein GCM10009730_62650 [Streptomyces albidochromogenes]
MDRLRIVDQIHRPPRELHPHHWRPSPLGREEAKGITHQARHVTQPRHTTRHQLNLLNPHRDTPSDPCPRSTPDDDRPSDRAQEKQDRFL